MSSLTTSGAIYDRINSLVAGQGFTRAIEPFSFDLQPAQNVDATYRVEIALQSVDGYIGEVQGELHRVTIWLARKTKRAATGAYRQLLADLELLESALTDDYAAYDYNYEKTGADVPPPAPNADFVVGMLEGTVDFDRAL